MNGMKMATNSIITKLCATYQKKKTKLCAVKKKKKQAKLYPIIISPSVVQKGWSKQEYYFLKRKRQGDKMSEPHVC